VKHTYSYFYKLAIEAISVGCSEDLCPVCPVNFQSKGRCLLKRNCSAIVSPEAILRFLVEFSTEICYFKQWATSV